MRAFGWVLFGLGALLLLAGGFSDASVASQGAYSRYLPDRVVNYSLMFGALKMMLAGGFLLVAGAIFLARTPPSSLAPNARLPSVPARDFEVPSEEKNHASENPDVLKKALELRNAQSAKADRITAIAVGLVVLLIVVAAAVLVADYARPH